MAKTKGYPNDAQHKAIPPEVMQVGTPYAITINPSDDFQYWGQSERLMKFLHKFYGLIKEIKYAKLILYPEMSQKGRLHFHGLLEVYDVYNFYLTDLRVLQIISQYEIDTIDKEEIWQKYCTKQEHLMKPKVIQEKGFSYPCMYFNQIYQQRFMDIESQRYHNHESGKKIRGKTVIKPPCKATKLVFPLEDLRQPLETALSSPYCSESYDSPTQ